MHPLSCINTHHDLTDLVNHEMVKITKTCAYNITCASDDTFKCHTQRIERINWISRCGNLDPLEK